MFLFALDLIHVLKHESASNFIGQKRKKIYKKIQETTYKFERIILIRNLTTSSKFEVLLAYLN